MPQVHLASSPLTASVVGDWYACVLTEGEFHSDASLQVIISGSHVCCPIGLSMFVNKLTKTLDWAAA